MKYVLGIDTSCYTTSVAILDETGKLITDERKILSVKPGGRGLAQSEMVFQHTRNLPALFEQAAAMVEQPLRFQAIGVSGYPRPLPDSYMPAFLVGDGYARVLAAAYQSKLQRISHQEGHIFAGIWSVGGPALAFQDFLAVHVSGGTTEIVKVKMNDEQVEIVLLGGSMDLHAGQFIDRIGVGLQLPFPAGRHLEQLAKSGLDCIATIPVSVKKMDVSFSGPATYAERLIEQGVAPAGIAAGVEYCIAETISRMVKAAIQHTGLSNVLLVGGVASNQFIRDYVQSHLARICKVRLFFPEKQYSPDNAIGTAYYALSHC
ncbi:MAG: hypothetical protein ABFC84_07310 [Veillonellales bacterium]